MRAKNALDLTSRKVYIYAHNTNYEFLRCSLFKEESFCNQAFTISSAMFKDIAGK